MNLASFSVQRYQFTIVAFGMLAALGISSLAGIPKAEDPTFPIPSYSIVAIYPGASPTDLEKLVVDPIEERLKTLDDLKDLKTEIGDGLAVLNPQFVAGSDADKKYDDVLREINALRPKLPAALQSLEVKRFNPSNVSVIEVVLVSETASYRTLGSLAEQLKKRLENLPGVKDSAKWATPHEQVRVSLDLPRLSALGFSPFQVIGALQNTNVNIPAGSVEMGGRKFNVKTSGDFASVEEVQNTVVGTASGALVRVADVATVSIEDEDQNDWGRFNGKRAVFVTATQKDGENIFNVRRRIQGALDAFKARLPADVKLEIGFDQEQNVSHRLTGFTRDFVLAIALVLLTLLPLGLRASAIVMISIPLSLAIGVAALRYTGFSINQLSIVGFVIALGLLVDDSIVVIENITRFLRQGHGRREAAILATKQIALPVLGCTATLIFAFLPILFLPGVPGQFIRSLPLAVVFTILASLVVALTIIPFLASLILPKHEAAEGNLALRLLHRGIKASYDPLLHRALAHPYLTVAAAAALTAASFLLVPRVGFSLFPKAGTPWFLVDIETAQGSNLGDTDRAARFAETELAKHPEVVSVLTNVGRGNPQIYYNVTPKNQTSNFAELFIGLKEYDPKQTPKLYADLRQAFAAYPGARVELREFEQGPQIDAPIAIRVIGDDLAQIDAVANQVEHELRVLPGTLYVKNPARDRKADLRVQIDRAKAGLLGVAVGDVDRGVRVGIGGVVAGSYRVDGEGDDTFDINVVAPRGPGAYPKPSIDALDRVYLTSQTGAQIPLAQLADLEFESSPTEIRHYNKERVVTVTSQVLPGFNTDKVTKQLLARLDKLTLPPGVRLAAAGEIESREESFGGLGTAILIAAFGILAVLVLEFGTFKGTLIVASVIPLGIVGGIVALFLTGNSLSFTASIGFIALIGIEVKNSILLVDFTNQLRAEGLSVDAAIERAGETRFVPILLTTLTALGGLLPLALENSALYSPLAWVIIGGLVTSTVLTRLVTPVVYKLLAPEVAPATPPSLVPAAA
jgi:multidrug efflux pump subunit AcrB